jgi:hypothetical protein
LACRRSRPEGSAARTKGKKWGVGGSGKTRGVTVRIETRGGAVSATEASPPFAGVETLGTLPRMTHDDDGGAGGDAICGESWAWGGMATKRNRKKQSLAWCGCVVCRGVEEGAERKRAPGNKRVAAFRV